MESKAESKSERRYSDDFSKECADHVDRHVIKRRSNFLCCVDGSTFGDYTLQNALSLSKKHDHVTVFHAFKDDVDESKLFPVEYRQKEMKLKYECELVGHLPSSRYSMWWVSREPESNLKAVDELKNELHRRRGNDDYPDFVLLGHVGRKGKKDTQTTLGSNSDVSLRSLYLPLIIVKQPCPPTNRTFMLSVNSSDYSERGLDILLHLVKPKDKLILFHFYTVDSEEHIENAQLLKKKYEDELDAHGPVDSSFQLIEKEQGKAMTHCIVDYVNEVEPTFLGICPRGRASISSLSEYVVNNVYCSVVFCKT
mmetsp:Transcript_6380/g.10455  ORF Transcript_6380/g.10455 Transcript_6380/m.10455 type:complete len:310 (+) Transcript_6380:102-1031(+)